MLDQELRKLGPPIKFDNTIRTTFTQCPRKFYWWRRGYDYSIRPAYFTFGSAWGIAQGVWHLSEGPRLAQGEGNWEDLVDLAVGKAILFWDKEGRAEGGVNTKENLETLFRLYAENYQLEPWGMVTDGAERGFLFPLEGTEYFLGGALDGQLYWEGLGSLFKEDKTTGVYLNDQYIRGWNFSSQVTGYCWYGHKLYGDEFFGVLMDMASKRVTKAGKTAQFERNLEKRSEENLREFEEDWRRQIWRIEDAWENWHWPKTTDTINCVGGIGKSPCLYQKLCLGDQHFEDIAENLDPCQFDNIVINPEPWAPWEWENSFKELTGAGRGENNVVQRL